MKSEVLSLGQRLKLCKKSELGAPRIRTWPAKEQTKVNPWRCAKPGAPETE